MNTTYTPVWDLDSLLPHPETSTFRKEMDRFRADLEELAGRSDRLPALDLRPEVVGEWTSLLRDYESLEGRATDLHAFVECHAAADANNKHFQRLEAELSALDPWRERIATQIEFALKESGEERLREFVEQDEWLKEIAFFLEDRRKNAALRLPKDQELLAADLAVDGIHAWGRLYDRISGDLKIRIMERGEIVEKSPGQVHFDSPQPAVRENNFYAADKAWQTIADTCADALNHIAGTRLTRYRRLGVQDHLDAPLRLNRMRRETLDAMWSAISDRKATLLQYFEAKARLLGLEKLRWYDLQAPVAGRPTGGASKSLSYDDACAMIVRTFTAFSPELGEFARMALQDRWIEAENRSGKRQGGFCTGFPTKRQSRIFMTFMDTPDSMSTLAHELGHAYHSWVLRDRPLFLQEYPMNLAETASTFAEAILNEVRLEESQATSERLSILDTMLSDATAFLMNIHTRFLFEDNFHKERRNGEVSATRLSELMLAAQREAYLDGLADDGWNPNFWISKLHFYISSLPFYNFPYTFGYLLSLGTYAVARNAGADFPEQYRRLLIATGCQETEDAVRSTLGYDLTKPDFWNRSLDVVDERVRQFVELAG